MRLSGKHALVTGGGRGIGLAIAKALAAEGCKLTLLGRDAARLQAACAEIGSSSVECGFVLADVSDEQQVTSAFAQARAARGPIELLINNAGAATSAPFKRTDSALWQSMLGSNLTGPFNCIAAAQADMLAAGFGRVVNVASTAGLKGYAYVAAYCAAKHGVIGLTRALALEWAQKGITVNAVCPGYTETEITSNAIENIVNNTTLSSQQAKKELEKTNPQLRLVQPAEVASAVLWLCLPGSASITGQAISVSGGEVMVG